MQKEFNLYVTQSPADTAFFLAFHTMPRLDDNALPPRTLGILSAFYSFLGTCSDVFRLVQ